MDQFYEDIIRGLSSSPKYLLPKYFYDAEGDKLFQQIMHMPEYYLTNSELEIFRTQCKEIVEVLNRFKTGFDVVELGAGDAYKSTELLQCLLGQKIDFTYYPTDISENTIRLVERELPRKLPDLKIKGLVGEFFEALSESSKLSNQPKVVLFLGANIGNMPPDDAEVFFKKLREHLSYGDLVVVGFDLKKNPWIIFNAYNDKQGITKKFNLNLLHRINKTFNANFDTSQFDHFENYDPASGACKSYLFSLKTQTVNIGDYTIFFEENECIFMETSHKYTIEEIGQLSKNCCFKSLINFFDNKKWYTDVIWECI